MSGETYKIRTVSDFLRVPPDRRELCAREFVVWLNIVDDVMTLGGGARNFRAPVFEWVDDDKHTADVSITTDGGERLFEAVGTMKGFS